VSWGEKTQLARRISRKGVVIIVETEGVDAETERHAGTDIARDRATTGTQTEVRTDVDGDLGAPLREQGNLVGA